MVLKMFAPFVFGISLPPENNYKTKYEEDFIIDCRYRLALRRCVL